VTPHPAEHTPRVVATYHVRHAWDTAAEAADRIVALLAAGVRIIDLSDHDRHADVVLLRSNESTDER
jgi:hypothetical protein